MLSEELVCDDDEGFDALFCLMSDLRLGYRGVLLRGGMADGR